MKLPSRSRLLQRARHLPIENKWLKLLSLALAALLFALARQPVSDVRLSDVGIEFSGLKPGVELSGDVSKTVSLRLRGPRDLVRGLVATQLSVPVDLSQKEEGERVIQLRPEDVAVPDTVEVIQIEPANIKVLIEPTARKTVAVEPQLTGAAVAGMELYGVKTVPNQVELEGPRSQLNAVQKVVTETVNLDGRTQNFTARVEVEVPQESLRLITKGPIELSLELGEQRVTQRFDNIPVQMPAQHLAARLLTERVTAELYGPRSALARIRPNELRAELQVSTATGEAASVPVRVPLPPDADPRIQVRAVIPATAKLKPAR